MNINICCYSAVTCHFETGDSDIVNAEMKQRDAVKVLFCDAERVSQMQRAARPLKQLAHNFPFPE